MAVADGGLRQEPRGLCAGQYGRRCAAAGRAAATTAGFKGKRASGRKSQFGERCADVRLHSRCFLGDPCSLWLACRNHPFAHDHVATPLLCSANARYGSRLTRCSSLFDYRVKAPDEHRPPRSMNHATIKEIAMPRKLISQFNKEGDPCGRLSSAPWFPWMAS